MKPETIGLSLNNNGTVDFSSEIAMPLDSTAECAKPRRGLKTVSKLCAPAFSAVINHLIFRQRLHQVYRYMKDIVSKSQDIFVTEE